MKVPISECHVIDLDAPTLSAYEVISMASLAGSSSASIARNCTGMVPPKGIGKPIATTQPARIGRLDTIWRMRDNGRKPSRSTTPMDACRI
jgi:hypothetical protein